MIKDSHVAGDTFDETIVIPDYPATDGWTLKYFFAPRFYTPVQAPITITATASGADYLVQAAPATTALWAPGIYTWRRRVEKTGAAQTLDKNGNGGDWSGEFTVQQNPSTMVQGFDGRSEAAKAVDDCRTALAIARAPGSSILRYTIGSREMHYQNIEYAMAGILKQLDFWQRQLNNENDAAAMAKGLGNPRNVGIRLTRV